MSSNYTLAIPRCYMQMGPADISLRANFYMWFLHRCMEEPQFPRQILLIDKCRFTRDAVSNTRNFLQEIMDELLEDVSLDICRRLWFLHDSAPAHFAGAVRFHFNRYFRKRWRDRDGPTAWPPQ